MEKAIIWADGAIDCAIEIDVPEMSGVDIEKAASLLGCDADQVNQCRPGEMDFYGVTLKDDIFTRPKSY
jgi:hypothetical protein